MLLKNYYNQILSTPYSINLFHINFVINVDNAMCSNNYGLLY